MTALTSLLLAATVTLSTGGGASVPLPGENGTKPALGPYPFPDRISAYVWRNWGLVDPERLARVVKAEPLVYDAAAVAKTRAVRRRMARLAQRELEAAQALWPLVRADSRIGYECSNHYFYLPRDLGEKMLTCFAALDLAK